MAKNSNTTVRVCFALYVTVLGVVVIVLQLTGVLAGAPEAAVQGVELVGKLFG